MATTCNSCFWFVHFKKSFPLKPLGQMNWNLVGIICERRGTQAQPLLFILLLSTIIVYHLIFYCFIEKLHSSCIFISGGQVVIVSTDFDFTLLYKLIRNLLTAIPAPTCGWGNPPLPGHLNETDDIERIRHLRNDLVHNSDFEICITDFSIHWTDLSQVK